MPIKNKDKIKNVFEQYRNFKFYDVSNPKAKDYVELVEYFVNQLPDMEKELIQRRYMTRNYNYISDYTVYEVEMFISAPFYNKIRKRAFEKLSLLFKLDW